MLDGIYARLTPFCGSGKIICLSVCRVHLVAGIGCPSLAPGSVPDMMLLLITILYFFLSNASCRSKDVVSGWLRLIIRDDVARSCLMHLSQVTF